MKLLFFLAAGMFVMGCEDYLFAGLLPEISTSLNVSVVAVAQGCAVFGVAYIASIPLCAFMVSKKSVRSVLIMALLFFIMGNAITLFSTSLTSYIIGRFIAGLGGGLFLPIAVAAGIQMMDTNSQGRALGVMWGSNIGGGVIGVPLGLWMARHLGWRSTVALIIGLATIAFAGIVLKLQNLRVTVAPPSLRDQFRLLVNPKVLAIISVTLFTAIGCLGLYTYISQVLAGTQNSSEVAVEVAFSLWSFGGLMGSIGIGYLLDRLQRPQIVMTIILVVLLATLASIPLLRVIPYFGLLPFLIWGAMGWASATPQQYSLMKIKPGHESILIALNSSAVSLGSVIGTALGGVVLVRGMDAGMLPYLTSVFILIALVAQTFFNRRLDLNH